MALDGCKVHRSPNLPLTEAVCPVRSACDPHRQWIEEQIILGRNAMAIYQDLVVWKSSQEVWARARDPDLKGTVKIDVKLSDETVWLTQQFMAELFQTTKQNIPLCRGPIITRAGNIFSNSLILALRKEQQKTHFKVTGNNKVTKNM